MGKKEILLIMMQIVKINKLFTSNLIPDRIFINSRGALASHDMIELNMINFKTVLHIENPCIDLPLHASTPSLKQEMVSPMKKTKTMAKTTVW
jgi:hypothetical protein